MYYPRLFVTTNKHLAVPYYTQLLSDENKSKTNDQHEDQSFLAGHYNMSWELSCPIRLSRAIVQSHEFSNTKSYSIFQLRLNHALG